MRISRLTKDRLSIEEIKCEGEQQRADIILAQDDFVCHFSQSSFHRVQTFVFRWF